MAGRKIWLLFGLMAYMAHCVSTTDEMELPPDAPSLPSPEALRQSCRSNADCDENRYCGGRGHPKRCLECFECSLVKRRPKKESYEGSSCATHQTECGDCVEGYEFVGGVCGPKPTTSSTTAVPIIDAPQRIENDKVSDGSNAPLDNSNLAALSDLVVAIIVVIVILLLIVIWPLRQVYRIFVKPRGRRSEEEDNLTSSTVVEHPSTVVQHPSAPPSYEADIYQSQPPFAPLPPLVAHGKSSPSYTQRLRGGYQNSKKNFLKRVSFRNSESQQAAPFNVGNGAGDWEREGPRDDELNLNNFQYQAGNADHVVNDETDNNRIVRGEMGAAEYVEDRGDQGQEQMEVDPQGPPEPMGRGARVVAQGNIGRGDNRVQRVRRSSVPRARPSGRQQTRPRTPTSSQNQPRHFLPDPVLGSVSLWVNMGFSAHLPNTPPTGFGHPTETSTPVRNVNSAPPSPLGRMDGTSFTPMDDLQNVGNFVLSSVSLDSGTGTNDASRSTASRSVSGNDVRPEVTSDMDDSLYDFENQMSPIDGALPSGYNESPSTVPDMDVQHRGLDFA